MARKEASDRFPPDDGYAAFELSLARSQGRHCRKVKQVHQRVERTPEIGLRERRCQNDYGGDQQGGVIHRRCLEPV